MNKINTESRPRGGLFDLQGKTVLVTGSTGGLGSAIARGLAENGATVVLNGRNRERLEAAVERSRKAGLDVHGVAFDVTDFESITPRIGQIESEVGVLDVLVNNAGITRRASLEDLEEADWREVIDTNLTAAFLVAKAAVPGMIARKRGKIINIGSLMSDLGRATTGAYAASKGGIRMLTRAMTADWARHNIQINAIGPGYFVTDLTRPLADDAAFTDWLTQRTPVGRWGQPEELVGTAVFLASAASDFVNGQIIYVDGGIRAVL
jgi:gluconate 5-dehydrogenase